MGGMLSLLAAAMYPDRVGRTASISAGCRSHPTAIALRYMQRRILMADPHWNGSNRTPRCAQSCFVPCVQFVVADFQHMRFGCQRWGGRREEKRACLCVSVSVSVPVPVPVSACVVVEGGSSHGGCLSVHAACTGGSYYGGAFPVVGLKHARELATISYRSGPEWEQRFGRRLAPKQPGARRASLLPDFLIETYLDHQGNQWCMQYDPNSLLYISKAMDMFDMTGDDPLSAGGGTIQDVSCPTLVIGVRERVTHRIAATAAATTPPRHTCLGHADTLPPHHR